jgi:hypothetical protein
MLLTRLLETRLLTACTLMRCKSFVLHCFMEGNANKSSGGGNGMSAFPSAVHFDVPVVDGDAMGRAYPTMYHGKSIKTPSQKHHLTCPATFSVYGHSLTPCVLSDARGNTSVVMVSNTTTFSIHRTNQTRAPIAPSALRVFSEQQSLNSVWAVQSAPILCPARSSSPTVFLIPCPRRGISVARYIMLDARRPATWMQS